jgi:hypothetical protein
MESEIGGDRCSVANSGEMQSGQPSACEWILFFLEAELQELIYIKPLLQVQKTN